MKGPGPDVLVAIVGPTAVGKTGLAVQLGKRFEVEVVSADSRQVYRYMDVGTAKPSPEQRRCVPHHLVDIVAPDQPISLAEYQELAHRAITAVLKRGRLPLLVGGTGQYVWAVIENWLVPRVPPQPSLRRCLECEARRKGPRSLHARLRAVDPKAAMKIHPNNVRRVIRALEVFEVTGRPISEQQGKGPPRYRSLVIGLTGSRCWLYKQADARVDRMLEQGLIEETRELLASGYSPDLPALSSLGYKQIIDYLQSKCSLQEAICAIKSETHRFIRQQYTWFRENDQRIHWFKQPVDSVEVAVLVERFIRNTR